MFAQSRDPNNKHKPVYKKIVIEQTIPSLLVSRNNQMMKIKEAPKLDLNLPKNHLYNTSVLLLVKLTLTEQITNLQNPMIDTVVEVHHAIVIQIALLRNDNYRRVSRSHRSPYSSPHRSPYRRDSRPTFRSRSYSRDKQCPQYTSSYRPPSQPQESRPF